MAGPVDLMRIALVTSDNPNTLFSLWKAFPEFGDQIRVIVVTRRMGRAGSRVRGTLDLLGTSGVRYTGFKLFTNLVISRYLSVLGLPASPTEALKAMGLRPRVIVTSSANSPAVTEALISEEVDVLLAAGCGEILKGEVRGAVKGPSVNLHSSLLPAFAGWDPYFWALLNGEQEAGATLHLMADTVDAGEMIAQERFSLGDLPSVWAVVERLWEANNKLVTDFLNSGADCSTSHPMDPAARSYFGHPTRSDVTALRRMGYPLVPGSEALSAVKREGEKIAQGLGLRGG
jgi:folate-dependent phosphoribosylglycinamide formyltransferase PurN